jgi:hypothetical protein
MHPAIAQAVDPAVHGQWLFATPGILDDRRAGDIEHLFEHVQFTQTGVLQRQFAGLMQALGMLVGDVGDVAQPVVGQPQTLLGQAGVDAAAAVVADHQDVLDLEYVYRVLDGRQAVQVGMHHHVGDIAVHEHLARCHVDDLIGRHPRVGTADPQVLRGLLFGQAGKEPGIFAADPFGPLTIVFKQMVKRTHR